MTASTQANDLPVDIWTNVLRYLPGKDKCRAARVNRATRAASEQAWSEDDYWHVASGGTPARPKTLRVPHEPVPSDPSSQFWRTLSKEIDVARQHQLFGVAFGRSSDLTRKSGLRGLISPLKPALALRLLAMAPAPGPWDAEVSEWWSAYAEVLQCATRSSEAAPFARLAENFEALRVAIEQGDVPTIERFLAQGLPVPRMMGSDADVEERGQRSPSNMSEGRLATHPASVPALVAAAIQQGDEGRARIAELFVFGDLAEAQIIVQQPEYQECTSMPLQIMALLSSNCSLQPKAALLAETCSPAQREALTTQGEQMLLDAIRWSHNALPGHLDALLPLWLNRREKIDAFAIRLALRYSYTCLVSGTPYEFVAKAMKVFKKYGANLDAVLYAVLRTKHYERTEMARILGNLGARIDARQYHLLYSASEPHERKTLDKLRAAAFGGVLGLPRRAISTLFSA